MIYSSFYYQFILYIEIASAAFENQVIVKSFPYDLDIINKLAVADLNNSIYCILFATYHPLLQLVKEIFLQTNPVNIRIKKKQMPKCK